MIDPALQYIELYLDYYNNYITVAAFAQDYGITTEEAKLVLCIGKAFNNA